MPNKKFSDLRAKMPEPARAEVRARAAELLREMALADLRRAHDLTQHDVAKKLNVNQAWISKFERQTDMYLSTLRAYVEAVGGQLELFARFADGNTVRINGLAELASLPLTPVSGGEIASAVASANAGNQDVSVEIWTNTTTKTVPSNTPGRTRTPSSVTTRAA